MTKYFNVFTLKIAILITFFLVLEWRWQLELLGINVPNPYYLTAVLAALLCAGKMIICPVQKHRFSTLSLVIILLMVYEFAIFLISVPELLKIDSSYVVINFGVWTINFALYFIALDTLIWNSILRYKIVILFAYITLAVAPAVLLFCLGNASEVNYNLRNLVSVLKITDKSHGVSYQSFGMKIAVLSFLALSVCPKIRSKFIIFCTTILSLYVVGSKASLVGFLFAITSYVFLSMYHKKDLKKMYLLSMFLCILLICGVVYIVTRPDLQKSENWIIQSFAKGNEDKSVQSRKELAKINAPLHCSMFFLGDYAFDVKLGRPGTRTHSVLGNFEYYGIIYFLLFVGLWLYILYKLIAFRGDRTVLIDFTMLSILFFSPLICIAYTGTGYLNYFVFGCAVTAIDSMNCNLTIRKRK